MLNKRPHVTKTRKSSLPALESIVLLFFIALLTLGCGLFSNPDKRLLFSPFGNEPNDSERQYYQLAGALASEKPCFLISPDSYTAAPRNSSIQHIRECCSIAPVTLFLQRSPSLTSA